MTLSRRFKMLTNRVLELITIETYFLEDICYYQPPAQYVCTIMCYGLGCNIIDIIN